jgi:hypothetical protein
MESCERVVVVADGDNVLDGSIRETDDPAKELRPLVTV